MDIKFGLKILAASSLLALAGCMSTNQEQSAEIRATNAEKLKFANAISVALVNSVSSVNATDSVTPVPPGQAPQIDFAALGCPKLGKFMEDLQTNTGNELPQSGKELLECFGIFGPGDVNDIDGITEKIQTELPQILDCICGGSALSALLSGKTVTFSGAASAAASSSFTGSSASASGSSFNGSSSTGAGTGFNGSSSSAAAGGFNGD